MFAFDELWMDWRCQVDRQGKSTQLKQIPGADTQNVKNVGPYFPKALQGKNIL